ncbi:MAG: sporulation protein YunB [Firmicutes bacterium]|nr:sporulation protein YunB [Bacillota bacterium]
MRRFRRRRPRLRRRVWLLWAALAAGLVGLWLAGRSLGPVVGTVAEMETRAAALELVNRVVAAEVVGAAAAEDLVRYETDGAGNVTLLQVNTPAVNRLAARAVTAVERELRGLTARRFTLPLGELLGNPFLAHLGPRVPVQLKPVGAVTARVRQQFDAAGFNQTRHQVLLDLEVRVRVVVPLITREVQVTSTLPLAETVIAGRVPAQLWLGAGAGTVPFVPGGAGGSPGGGS